MVAGILGYNFLNSCTELTVDGTAAKAVRKLMVVKKQLVLPLIIGGQKD
jgi:electron transfer flavoprotein beta subunit